MPYKRTPVDQMIEIVDHYLQAVKEAQQEHDECLRDWTSMIEALAKSLKILERHEHGHHLLTQWIMSSREKTNINPFINDLWMNIEADHVNERIIQSIADSDFRCFTWEITVGSILLIRI